MRPVIRSIQRSTLNTLPRAVPVATALQGNRSWSSTTSLQSQRQHEYASWSSPSSPSIWSCRRHLSFSYPAPRKLDSIVKLDKMSLVDPNDIRTLWLQQHESSHTASAAVISSSDYAKLEERAKKNRFFVFPVRRINGQHPSTPSTTNVTATATNTDSKDTTPTATPTTTTSTDTSSSSSTTSTGGNASFFTVVSDFQDRQNLMASLADYQSRASGASPWTVTTFYTELAPSKGIVLVRMDVVHATELFRGDADRLLTLLIEYYTNDDKFTKWVETFNKRPDQFNFQTYMDQCP
jgi:hypothetical protein